MSAISRGRLWGKGKQAGDNEVWQRRQSGERAPGSADNSQQWLASKQMTAFRLIRQQASRFLPPFNTSEHLIAAR